MPYCPNCSAQLDAKEGGELCWNCGADLGPNSNWRAVAVPPGEFRPFTAPKPKAIGAVDAERQPSPPPQRRPLPRSVAFFLVLHAAVLTYAMLSFVLSGVIAWITFLTIGALGLLFLALEYAVPPLLAIVAGYYSRWSMPAALFLGYPLVLLATVVFPVAPSQKVLGVPVPWLAAHVRIDADIHPTIWEQVVGRVPTYTVVFMVALLLGQIARVYGKRKQDVVEQVDKT